MYRHHSKSVVYNFSLYVVNQFLGSKLPQYRATEVNHIYLEIGKFIYEIFN